MTLDKNDMIQKESSRVLTLLSVNQPAFQLKSGTSQLASSEELLSRNALRTDAYGRASHACSFSLLNFLADNVTSSMVTLETGGGWSTCLLATCAQRHICINPDITANELIVDFLRQNQIKTGDLQFMTGPSDAMLPRLGPECMLNTAFIDGCHSFPIPIIDWFFIDMHLVCGGILVIDDTHIRSVAILVDYLNTEKSYEKDREIGKAVVYRKINNERKIGWAGQPFNKIMPV